MPVLDFQEIPRADVASGDQDSFELFTRDFLSFSGYTIVSGPDRGSDGGRDIIALETRSGVAGETMIRWLVSCKHKAHSGTSVTLDDERDILDRVTANQCQGFIGFYSTLPSASLTRKLEGLKAQSGIEFQLFDRERIELNLLTTTDGFKLAKRYFNVSFSTWSRENPEPADLFEDQDSLFCKYCQKDLLKPASGIVVVWTRFDRDENENWIEEEIIDVYWCCKGKCDKTLAASQRQANHVDRWQDIPDLCIPTLYLRRIATFMDQLHRGVKFRDEALEKTRELIITLFPFVCRDLTTKENERIALLFTLP
jgi:restriction endonuclease